MAGKESASAEVLEIPGSMDEAMETGFLPEDRDYLLTGRFKSEKTEGSAAPGKQETEQDETPSSENTDGSAPSSSEIAADSEAAKQQLEEKKPGIENREPRWKKRERELKEAKAEIARLKAQGSQPQNQRSETPQDKDKPQPVAEAKAATDTEPKIDDVDPKTGQPKWKTYGEFEKATRDWLRKDILREVTESSSKTRQQQEFENAERTIQQVVEGRIEAIRKTHPDYNDVMTELLAEKDEHGREALFYTKGSPIDGFFLDSDRSQEVFYELGQNFDKYKHIFARNPQGQYLLNPVRQLRELSKIENALPAESKPNSSPARPITQASRPPHQVSGKGTVSKDAIEEAVEGQDSESYMREANNRDPRVRSVLQARKGK
jgi:hypothetical protein